MDRSDIEKKWIIEIPKTANKIIVVGVYGDKEVYAYSVDVHDLDSYAEPDTEKVREEAYRQGYDTGYGTKVNEFYEQGLADAWDAARKIVTMPDREFINSDILELDPGESIFTKYTASEAIEKIRQHEQEKEQQIQVGDEVILDGRKYVVLVVDEDGIPEKLLEPDGYTLTLTTDVKLPKTGRHYPQIAEVLAKMKEES